MMMVAQEWRGSGRSSAVLFLLLACRGSSSIDDEQERFMGRSNDLELTSLKDMRETIVISAIEKKRTRIFDKSWVLAPELISSSSIVAWLRNETVSSSRYWSAAQDASTNEISLYAKTSPDPSATPYDRLIRFGPCDAELNDWHHHLHGDRSRSDCVHESKQKTQIDDINLARNTAVLRLKDGTTFFLGGEHSGKGCGKAGDPCGTGASVWRQSTLMSSTAQERSSMSYDRRIDGVINGFHGGCIDNRKKLNHCEYDGRWSLAVLSPITNHKEQKGQLESAPERIFLYGRANLHPDMGGRWVSVASMNATEFYDAIETERKPSFDSFRKLVFAEYDKQFTGRLATARKKFVHDLHLINILARAESTEINLYFFAVNPNPVDNGASFLAVYPINIGYTSTQANKSTFIALSLSCDGIHFSAPLPILDSIKATVGPRGLDHPVDGFVRRRSQLFSDEDDQGFDYFVLYEHVNVRGITHHRDKNSHDVGLRDFPPHLVAHTISYAALATFTTKAKAHLRRAYHYAAANDIMKEYSGDGHHRYHHHQYTDRTTAKSAAAAAACLHHHY